MLAGRHRLECFDWGDVEEAVQRGTEKKSYLSQVRCILPQKLRERDEEKQKKGDWTD